MNAVCVVKQIKGNRTAKYSRREQIQETKRVKEWRRGKIKEGRRRIDHKDKRKVNEKDRKVKGHKLVQD